MPIKNEREYRILQSFEITDNQDAKLILRGVPIVFNSQTLMYEYEGIKFYETIERNALDGADLSDFIFNYNHSGRVYARSRNGTLKYNITNENMECTIELNSEDTGHQELYRDIKSGLIDKMSFAFTVAESKYNKDTHLRSITKIKKLYDISAVDIPAYNNTSISARNFFEMECQKEVMLQERQRKLLIAKTYL